LYQLPPHSNSTLFPYTTLFRSSCVNRSGNRDGKIIGILNSCDLRSVANERKGCYQYAYDTVTKSIARGRDSLIKKVDCLALQRCFIERKATLFKFGEICQRTVAS